MCVCVCVSICVCVCVFVVGLQMFLRAGCGGLRGNGKFDSEEADGFKQGDRLGVLVDLDVGSLLFFKNGVQHGPGYPAGSVAGPFL